MRRPNALQWLGYCFGAGLPPELDSWVLHDTTCPTWALRQVARTLLLLAPLIVLVLLLPPGPFWIRGMAALGGVAMSLIYALGYIVEATENRLAKAGYPAGTGERIRADRAGRVNSDAVARRRQKMFERMDRRR